MRILSYIILALYFVLFWLFPYLATFGGLDIPSHTMRETDEDGGAGFWGLFIGTHLAALVAAFCLWLMDRTKWRIWGTVLVVSLIIIHLDRAYMTLKYPPLAQDLRVIWFNERGLNYRTSRVFIAEELDLTDPEDSSLRRYKDNWIKGNRTTIRVTARRYNLPPELLAGVAWMEVGGDPAIYDIISILVRGAGLFDGHPNTTSVGDVQIKGHHVADVYGIDPDTVGTKRMLSMQRALAENRALNLDIVAQHLDTLRQKAFPGSKSSLTQDQINALSCMYNAGYNEKATSDPSTILESGLHKRSRYGIDLLAKWDRMTSLLSQKED